MDFTKIFIAICVAIIMFCCVAFLFQVWNVCSSILHKEPRLKRMIFDDDDDDD